MKCGFYECAEIYITHEKYELQEQAFHPGKSYVHEYAQSLDLELELQTEAPWYKDLADE